MDAYAMQDSLPNVGVIFRAMRALEERWNTRNDREASEANCMGRDYCMGLEVVHGSQR